MDEQHSVDSGLMTAAKSQPERAKGVRPESHVLEVDEVVAMDEAV